ncbi:hypothetical protein T492DRAFT_843844 [Pavlovales sp. CCMP2436]|nr:hypothetical protein T492DRAFT_843844 [Pavlovales sp. CCMP2436]
MRIPDIPKPRSVLFEVSAARAKICAIVANATDECYWDLVTVCFDSGDLAIEEDAFGLNPAPKFALFVRVLQNVLDRQMSKQEGVLVARKFSGIWVPAGDLVAPLLLTKDNLPVSPWSETIEDLLHDARRARSRPRRDGRLRLAGGQPADHPGGHRRGGHSRAREGDLHRSEPHRGGRAPERLDDALWHRLILKIVDFFFDALVRPLNFSKLSSASARQRAQTTRSLESGRRFGRRLAGFEVDRKILRVSGAERARCPFTYESFKRILFGGGHLVVVGSVDMKEEAARVAEAVAKQAVKSAETAVRQAARVVNNASLTHSPSTLNERRAGGADTTTHTEI